MLDARTGRSLGARGSAGTALRRRLQVSASPFLSPPLPFMSPYYLRQPALKRHPRPAERRGRDRGLQAPGLAIPAPAPCHPRRPSPRGRSCTHSTLGACRRRTHCESRSASWPRRPTSCSYSCSSARASGWPWRAGSSGSSWRRSSWWVSWGLGTCVAPAGQSCSHRRTAGSGPQGQVCLQRPQAHRKGRRTALALALARILLCRRSGCIPGLAEPPPSSAKGPPPGGVQGVAQLRFWQAILGGTRGRERCSGQGPEPVVAWRGGPPWSTAAGLGPLTVPHATPCLGVTAFPHVLLMASSSVTTEL